jgi:hypothetical protein
VKPGDKVKNISTGRSAQDIGTIQRFTVNLKGEQIVIVTTSYTDMWSDYSRHADVEKLWPRKHCELIDDPGR